MVRERQILFSGPMVRAILEGRKTQTRRVCKPMNAWTNQDCREVRQIEGAPHHFLKGASAPIERLRCPYGRPGDRLWVRETWQAFFADEVPADRPRGPRHTMGIPAQPERESFVFYRADGDLEHPKMGDARWRPAIHLPRWASRITLEVVAVRVERLNEISQADAIAEGAPPSHPAIDAISREYGYEDFPRSWYGQTWESINGPGSWAANPWVWVIEFRRAS